MGCDLDLQGSVFIFGQDTRNCPSLLSSVSIQFGAQVFLIFRGREEKNVECDIHR